MPNNFPISSLRVAYKYLTKLAYEEGYKNPDGKGWENGKVKGIQFSGQGSLVPPVRDGKGDKVVDPPEVETDGTTPMLSKNIPPGSPRRVARNFLAAATREYTVKVEAISDDDVTIRGSGHAGLMRGMVVPRRWLPKGQLSIGDEFFASWTPGPNGGKWMFSEPNFDIV